jgi:L-ribulose-5-phosphate 3-epimerase
MDDESSYRPVVELLKRMAPVAEDAGMTLGLELSLGLADYQKLIGLVAHPAVRAY